MNGASCVLLVLFTASAEPAPTALKEWLLWGPYAGMAGLSVCSPDFEKRIRPARIDVTEAAGCGHVTKTAWKPCVSSTSRVDLNLPQTFADRPAIMEWSGGCAYAHTYLHADAEQRVGILVRTNWRAVAWLNGERTADTATLRAGWNRLLVKVFYPSDWIRSGLQNQSGWWFECHLSTPDGGGVPGLKTQTDDPARDPAELADPKIGLGVRTIVSLHTKNRWAPLFDENEPVDVELVVSEGQPNAKRATQLLHYTVIDCDGRTIAEAKKQTTYGAGKDAHVAIGLGRLPMGHYRVVGELRHGPGVTGYLPPLSFVVLRGAVNSTQDDGPRKLAGCDYWLMNSGTHRERVRWLARVGLLRNVGSLASWWTTLDEGKVGTNYGSVVDETLAEAQALGVEFVGYLEGGWPVEALQAEPRTHWLRQGLAHDRLVVWPWMPLPEYETPDYEEAVRAYVTQTVARYKDRIGVWKSYNEIDIAGKMPPEQYARIARILHEAVREADPEATMVGASLVYLGSDWCKELFHETDFARWHDVYDVHSHPMNPPKIGGSIGNGPSEGLTGLAVRIAEGAPKKPVWYGEVSPPLSHAEGGQWEQAANVVKQAAFAVTEPNVQVLAWLVPYGGAVPEIATSGPHHLPYPAVMAIHLCACLLDGRRVLEPLALGEHVEQVRVTAPGGGQTLVLWSDKAREISIPVVGETVTVIDPIGRRREMPVEDGELRLVIDATPSFVCTARIAVP